MRSDRVTQQNRVEPLLNSRDSLKMYTQFRQHLSGRIFHRVQISIARGWKLIVQKTSLVLMYNLATTVSSRVNDLPLAINGRSSARFSSCLVRPIGFLVAVNQGTSRPYQQTRRKTYLLFRKTAKCCHLAPVVHSVHVPLYTLRLAWYVRRYVIRPAQYWAWWEGQL